MNVLNDLLGEAGLPAAESTEQITGRGFDHRVYRATLLDGRRVVLRCFREPRTLEHARARFLAQHNAQAPDFLAGNDVASLHAFAPGVLLGDLIERGRITAAGWRSVGRAYARTHATPVPEPNTSIHRVVAMLEWATSRDWNEFEQDPELPAELKQRARDWRGRLWEYVGRLPEHVERLRRL